MILCIIRWIEKILRLPGDNPDKPKTLVMAPTGVAANLIGKIVTICCTYSLIYTMCFFYFIFFRWYNYRNWSKLQVWRRRLFAIK